MKLLFTKNTENKRIPAANRQQRLNKSQAITPCLFNAGFCGNFIIISRIKVSNILTGNSFESRAKQTLDRYTLFAQRSHKSRIQSNLFTFRSYFLGIL